MPESLEFELGKAADILVRQMLKLKAGESFLITIDSEGDWRVAEATARAAQAVDAKTAVVWYAAPPGVGAAADPYLPDSLKAAITHCDAWVEFANEYLLYSGPWQEMYKQHRVKYICLGAGMNSEMFVRCLGKINFPVLIEFQNRLYQMTKNARKMRITTHAGTDISFENNPTRPIDNHTGVADNPDIPHMLPGQIGWEPIEETMNGTVVFDGSLYPPIGLLRGPVFLEVKNAKIVKVSGASDAKTFEAWLASWNDPAMYNVVHLCYGCNPGAKLTGNIIEDERVWGVVEWGIGFAPPSVMGKAGPAASHTDGICLNPSIWLDDVQIEKEGRYVEPKLAQLAKKFGKQ